MVELFIFSGFFILHPTLKWGQKELNDQEDRDIPERQSFLL